MFSDKEEGKVTDKINLNEDELQNVSGGVTRTVDTKQPVDAVVRSGPGLNYPQTASLKSGTQVNTTGNTSVNGYDGRTWYEINYPLYGWMSGELLGYY